jgi:cytochrome P450
MQPAFHRTRVARYASTIVAETERVTATWNGEPFDIGAAMARLTLGAVGAALFGADLREEANRVAAVLARVLQRGTSLGALLALLAPSLGTLHRLLPKRASVFFPRERAELQAIVDPIVRGRRGTGGDDLLSLLLEARDDGGGKIDDAGLSNELVMLILAGHETTANALTWTWYLLARHPAVERTLHAELDAVLDGRTPDIDDVPKLHYTARVVDEALRLYPPAAAFARRPLAAIELGGYTIPRMASVFVSPYVTQRNPRYFADPLVFAPERWNASPPEKFAYFPFGGGSKMCIGEPFARLEAVLAVAAIARRYTLQLAGGAAIEPAAQAVMRPARPVLVTAVRR